MSFPFTSFPAAPWLAMASVKGMSPNQWLQLLENTGLSAYHAIFGNDDALEACQPLLRELRKKICWRRVEHALEWEASNANHTILYSGHVAWPDGFASLHSPPLVIFSCGNIERLKDNQIAIVGSRRASPSGLKFAETIAEHLAENHCTISSGLASGVDSAAHRGAILHYGRTVALMGTGIDIVYPVKNRQLYHDIVDSGGLVATEFWPGTPPKRHHFPQRNRLIAAITLGTLVVEATLKSGTLITANLAANMGRDVFAVPGNVYNRQAEGCHSLIQQGAKLVTSATDILEEYTFFDSNPAQLANDDDKKSEDQNLATDKLLDSVEFDVTGVDIIAERSALPVSVVMAALLEYELRGLVASVPGGYIKLRGK